MAHAFEDEFGIAVHALGAATEGLGKNGGEAGGLLAVESAGGGMVVVTRGSFGAIDARAPLDDVEIKLENAALAKNEFGDGDEGELSDLANKGAAGSEKKILDELLGNSGAAADASTFEIVFGGDLNGLPIEAVMLVEACVFGGNGSMLKIGADLAEGNEVVMIVIRSVVNPGLHAALDVDGGGRRVNPTSGDEEKDGEKPKGSERDEKPEKEGAERQFEVKRFGGSVGSFGHSSGYMDEGGRRKWQRSLKSVDQGILTSSTRCPTSDGRTGSNP